MKLTPTKIVKTLDQYVIGQQECKEALAIAIRDRWRTLQLPKAEREGIHNPNILLRGSSGSGKTLTVQMLAKHLGLPIYITPITRFTQNGYKGEDLDQIIDEFVGANAKKAVPKWYKDHLENSNPKKTASKKGELKEGKQPSDKPDQKYKTWPVEKLIEEFEKLPINCQRAARNMIINVRSGLRIRKSPPRIREDFWSIIAPKIDEEISITGYLDYRFQMKYHSCKSFQRTTISPRDVIGAAIELKKAKLTDERMINFIERDFGKEFEAGALGRVLDDLNLGSLDGFGTGASKVGDSVKGNYLNQFGIIFLDEFDKLADTRGDNVGGFGVQRELLTMVEGRKFNTKVGVIDTRNILFIAAGAFMAIDETGIMPELKGRFPITAELKTLEASDLESILRHTRNNRLIQERLKLKTEEVTLEFSDDIPKLVGQLAFDLNTESDSLGARRLDDIVAKLLRYISMNAEKYHGKKFLVDKAYFDKVMKDDMEKVTKLRKAKELKKKSKKKDDLDQS